MTALFGDLAAEKSRIDAAVARRLQWYTVTSPGIVGTRNEERMIMKRFHFDPFELRDAHGRWSKGGSNGESAQDQLRRLGATLKEEGKKGGTGGAKVNSRYDTAGRELRNAAKALDNGDEARAKGHLTAALMHIDASKVRTDAGERAGDEVSALHDAVVRDLPSAKPMAEAAKKPVAEATKPSRFEVREDTDQEGVFSGYVAWDKYLSKPVESDFGTHFTSESDAQQLSDSLNASPARDVMDHLPSTIRAVHPADKITVAANPKETAAGLSDGELHQADVELSRRAAALGKAGQVGKGHQAVRDEITRRLTGSSKPAAPKTHMPTIREVDPNSKEYTQDYNKGWAASERGSEGALERADTAHVSSAWYDGYMDSAAGREKYNFREARQLGYTSAEDYNRDRERDSAPAAPRSAFPSGKSVQEMHQVAGNRDALAAESDKNLNEYSGRLGDIASGPLLGTAQGNAAHDSKTLVDQEIARRKAQVPLDSHARDLASLTPSQRDLYKDAIDMDVPHATAVRFAQRHRPASSH